MHAAPDAASEDFIRLPGLFRRWEIEQVVETGADFHIEEAGHTADGTPLWAVYRRPHPPLARAAGTRRPR